jgi:Tol biopolymer transport system component
MADRERKRLDSWKEIAQYLRRNVTTVKRWEKGKGLPVYRLPGGKRQPVFAYEDEIDAWSSHGQIRSLLAEAQSPSLDPGLPVSESPRVMRKMSRPSLSFALAAFLLLCIGGVVSTVTRPDPKLSIARYTPLTNDGRNKGDALLTDGSRVYFGESGSHSPNGGSLAAVSVNGGGTEAISLPVHDEALLDLSPSGSEFLVGLSALGQPDNELWSVPVGKSPRRVGNLRVNYARWSRDGQQLVFTVQHDLFIANADGSESRKIASVGGQTAQISWSPDGKTLSFTERNYRDGEFSQSIWQVAADGSDLHRLLDGWPNSQNNCCGSWTPDGKFFIFQSTHDGSTDLWALPESPGILRIFRAKPFRLTFDSEKFGMFAVSPDGKQLFALGSAPRGQLERFDSRFNEFVPYLGSLSGTWVSFSRSGKSIAYIAYPDLTVWRANADGSNKTPITLPSLQADGLSWSPDEKQLALRARKPGRPWRIFLLPSDGGEPQPLEPGEAEQGVPTWSADGNEIAFGDVPAIFGKPDGTEAIHLFNLSTRRQTDLPGSSGLWSARWSPNGRFIAAITIIGQRLMIYDFRTKKWRQTDADNVNNLNWTADSKYVYYDTEQGERLLCRVSRVDGHVTKLTSVHNYPRLAWNWSGLAPDNSPLILRDLGSTEIYSLTLDSR